MSRVFVTGIGVMSAIGNTVAENRAALVAGKCGMSRTTGLGSRYSGVLPLGEVQLSTELLKKALHIADAGITRTSLLAIAACSEAIADARLAMPQLRSADTALIGATTVGGMCLTDELYRDAHEDNADSPFLSSYDCASVFMYLQEYYGMSGLIDTINTACSSAANAIMYGARLIKNGLATRAIVGGADSLSKFTINGFNSLRILSDEICKPFDASRKGLNLGEGAAFLVLESEGCARSKKIYAEVTGYCNTNDAWHQSALSDTGDGPYLAMEGALTAAGLVAGEIDMINAHGTATENNDMAESVAMIKLFGAPPAFGSTKSNTGHTLGASGSIEAVYSLLNLEHQEIYPSLHFSNPITATGLRPEPVYRAAALTHVMSNSFGFGGNCTSLIFSKA